MNEGTKKALDILQQSETNGLAFINTTTAEQQQPQRQHETRNKRNIIYSEAVFTSLIYHRCFCR